VAEEKNPIIAMCALGITPVLLSFVALRSNLPSASLYIMTVTNVTIVTNVNINNRCYSANQKRTPTIEMKNTVH
jgi:hypothetical protein